MIVCVMNMTWIQSIAAAQSMTKALQGSNKIMAAANKSTSLNSLQKTVQEFDKQNTMMDMRTEMSLFRNVKAHCMYVM